MMAANKAGEAAIILPPRIFIKTDTQAFNSKYYYALDEKGRINIKPNPDTGYIKPWHLMGKGKGLPYNEKSKRVYPVKEIVKISVDNNKLVAATVDGTVFHIDNILGPESEYRWKSNWGHPLGKGPQLVLPKHYRQWSISHSDPDVVKYYVDSSGNRFNHFCSSLFVLYPNGHEIHFTDPWTPTDWGYQVLTPFGGRFQALNMDTSSSTIFIINKYGDMYTRQVDFDIIGANPSPYISYSYYQQKRRKGVQNYYVHRTIPPLSWKKQPRIPGHITKEITILTTGEGSFARILRVKGINEKGEAGFWQKQLNSGEWDPHDFRVVSEMHIDTEELLENKCRDIPLDDQDELERYTYKGIVGTDITMEIYGFHFYDSPVQLIITFPNSEKLRLWLYHHLTFRTKQDDTPGFNGTNIHLSGAIAVPKDKFKDKSVNEFFKRYFQAKSHKHETLYIPVSIIANDHEVVLHKTNFPRNGYRLKRIE